VSKIVVAILIAPCISIADVNTASNTTEIRACPNTVKIETIIAPERLRYARYQDNAFRFMKVIY
jgi:hypothetical protein